MNKYRAWLLCGAAALTSGCGSWRVPTDLAGNIPRADAIVPATNFQLTPSTSITLEKMIYWGAYAGVAYLVLDPFAPNWEIEEAKFPNETVYMSLRMKRFYAGGAGEARAVFARRAQELARAGGYGGYQVLEYNEGIESSVLGSQRTASGVVQMTGKPLG